MSFLAQKNIMDSRVGEYTPLMSYSIEYSPPESPPFLSFELPREEDAVDAVDAVAEARPPVFEILHELPRKEEVDATTTERGVSRKRLAVHESIRRKLDFFYETNKIPHIIFHGASGTGKLTLVQEFIHRIYRGDKARMKTNVMTVNCSHGKGIKFIRDELKFFAKTNIQTSSGVMFKTILLINAHHLTIDAQSALRRCIELFSYNTRFFILLENKNKLLNPILSRFCEIYVPEYTDESENMLNLHTYSLSHKYDLQEQRENHRETIHAQLAECLIGRVFASDYFVSVAEDFYTRGISCVALMEWFEENRESWSETQFSNLIMCFHRIKTEFRSEKMLMFYLLDFAFRSGFELPPV